MFPRRVRLCSLSWLASLLLGLSSAALLAASFDWPQWGGPDRNSMSKETGLRSGTLYPLLMRLSEQGLLEHRWQEAERLGLPPRHVYRLTASGLALAREQELAAIAAERAGALA